MNIYGIIVILLVVFIVVYEMVPAAQSEIRDAMRKSRRRMRDMRQFIDDDDYDAIGKFQYSPFTMAEYLNRRDQCAWQDVRRRAEQRKQRGYGCVYWDGPDYHHPYQFWWQDGVMVRRRHNPKTHAPLDNDKVRRSRRWRLPFSFN